jgi:hypothetical protein
MNPTTADNLANLLKFNSTRVVLVITALSAYWLQLSPAEQAAYMASYPWLKHAAPLIALASFVWARVTPQASLQPPAQVAERVQSVNDQADTVPMPVARLSLEETEAILKAAKILQDSRGAR